jgi:hypothetical protein
MRQAAQNGIQNFIEPFPQIFRQKAQDSDLRRPRSASNLLFLYYL